MYDHEFMAAVQFVLQKEGGYVNRPDDPGGETKFGISKRAYPNLDIKSLTEEQAIEIYYRDYWTPVVEIVGNRIMRLIVFDAAVNHGRSRALAWAAAYDTPLSFMSHRFKFWASLSTFKVFGAGWVNRGASLLEHAERQAGNAEVVDVLIDHRPLPVRLLAAVKGKSEHVTYRVRPKTQGSGLKMDVR